MHISNPEVEAEDKTLKNNAGRISKFTADNREFTEQKSGNKSRYKSTLNLVSIQKHIVNKMQIRVVHLVQIWELVR